MSDCLLRNTGKNCTAPRPSRKTFLLAVFGVAKRGGVVDGGLTGSLCGPTLLSEEAHGVSFTAVAAGVPTRATLSPNAWSAADATLAGLRPPCTRFAVISLELPGHAARRLHEVGTTVSAPAGRTRFSFHPYNTVDDVNLALHEAGGSKSWRKSVEVPLDIHVFVQNPHHVDQILAGANPVIECV